MGFDGGGTEDLEITPTSDDRDRHDVGIYDGQVPCLDRTQSRVSDYTMRKTFIVRSKLYREDIKLGLPTTTNISRYPLSWISFFFSRRRRRRKEGGVGRTTSSSRGSPPRSSGPAEVVGENTLNCECTIVVHFKRLHFCLL